MAKSTAPEIVTLSPAQLEELLAKLAGLLPGEICQLVEKLFWPTEKGFRLGVNGSYRFRFDATGGGRQNRWRDG